MKEVNYIELAIPFFFLLIGIEILFNFLKKKDFYNFNDSINDLSCGITQQVLEVFFRFFIVGGYLYIYNNFRLTELSMNSVILWVICFLAVDFCYYLFHRTSHEVSIIWGSHAPHHQSEEYNLTVALRQGTFESVFSSLFYLPLALIGFHPIMFATCLQFDIIFQFGVHTRAVKKLGFLEYIFNTPSHHRVHHGKNPKYIDKNYGGVFIIWDKLLGTYQEEEEEVVYGTVAPLNSWNPLWANFRYWNSLLQKSKSLPKLSDKIFVFFRNPGWSPEKKHADIPYVEAVTYKKYRTHVPKGLSIYTLLQFFPILVFAVNYLEIESNLNIFTKFLFATIIVVTLVNIGGIFELKKWVLPLEITRLLSIMILINSFYRENILLNILVSVTILGFMLWYLKYRNLFLKVKEEKAFGI